MRRSNKQSKPASPAPWQSEAEAELSEDELRASIMRKLNRFIAEDKGYWKHCPRRACRRQHTCASPVYDCAGMPPMPEPSQEQVAAAMADFKRLMTQRIAEDEAKQVAGRDGK